MKKTDEKVIAYKCTRPDGTDFRTGTFNYAAAMAAGTPIRVDDCDGPTSQVCGRGVHVSPTARKTIQFAERAQRPCRPTSLRQFTPVSVRIC